MKKTIRICSRKALLSNSTMNDILLTYALNLSLLNFLSITVKKVGQYKPTAKQIWVKSEVLRKSYLQASTGSYWHLPLNMAPEFSELLNRCCTFATKLQDERKGVEEVKLMICFFLTRQRIRSPRVVGLPPARKQQQLPLCTPSVEPRWRRYAQVQVSQQLGSRHATSRGEVPVAQCPSG